MPYGPCTGLFAADASRLLHLPRLSSQNRHCWCASSTTRHRDRVDACWRVQVATVSAVVEERLSGDGRGTRLWLGNLVGSYVSYIDLVAGQQQPMQQAPASAGAVRASSSDGEL